MSRIATLTAREHFLGWAKYFDNQVAYHRQLADKLCPGEPLLMTEEVEWVRYYEWQASEARSKAAFLTGDNA